MHGIPDCPVFLDAEHGMPERCTLPCRRTAGWARPNNDDFVVHVLEELPIRVFRNFVPVMSLSPRKMVCMEVQSSSSFLVENPRMIEKRPNTSANVPTTERKRYISKPGK